MIVDDKSPLIRNGRSITRRIVAAMSLGGQYSSATHETGHLLGLTDRYSSFRFYDAFGQIEEAYLAHDGYENNPMVGSGLEINEDQINNWGRALLESAKENGDNFILKGLLEYRNDEAGRNLRYPYTEISEERKNKYIEEYRNAQLKKEKLKQ